MKSLAVAAALLALLAVPAQAQMGGGGMGGGGGRHQKNNDDSKTEDKKPKVDDKAYKEALKRIPEPKQKYDPWGVARPTDSDKKTK
jgi:opacity protein-like surface antigen